MTDKINTIFIEVTANVPVPTSHTLKILFKTYNKTMNLYIIQSIRIKTHQFILIHAEMYPRRDTRAV